MHLLADAQVEEFLPLVTQFIPLGLKQMSKQRHFVSIYSEDLFLSGFKMEDKIVQ